MMNNFFLKDVISNFLLVQYSILPERLLCFKLSMSLSVLNTPILRSEIEFILLNNRRLLISPILSSWFCSQIVKLFSRLINFLHWKYLLNFQQSRLLLWFSRIDSYLRQTILTLSLSYQIRVIIRIAVRISPHSCPLPRILHSNIDRRLKSRLLLVKPIVRVIRPRGPERVPALRYIVLYTPVVQAARVSQSWRFVEISIVVNRLV